MSKKPEMIGWNYRILAFPDIDTDKPYFEIRTVYYTNDGLPKAFGDLGHPINGASLKSIKWDLRATQKAFEKPVLWGDERFPNKYKKLKKK